MLVYLKHRLSNKFVHVEAMFGRIIGGEPEFEEDYKNQRSYRNIPYLRTTGAIILLFVCTLINKNFKDFSKKSDGSRYSIFQKLLDY
jgi:hypothetical protein